jgi:hypothetical protein
MLSLLVISLIACVQTNLVFQMRKRFRKDSADIGVLDQTTGSKINTFLNKKIVRKGLTYHSNQIHQK